MATSRSPPPREVPTATHRRCAPPQPGRARVLCLPSRPRAACPASGEWGFMRARKLGPTSSRELGLLALVASARCLPRRRGQFAALHAPREPARLPASERPQPCRASQGSLACESAQPCHFPRERAGCLACCARWLRELARMLRALVARAGSHAARDGCARWLACCARWLRALPRMLRAMVARAGSHAARDGAARWLAFCARWCRALGRWCLSMVPHAGALAPRDCAARWFRAQARMCCALVPRAGALAARFRWSFLARREVSCAGNGLPVPTCRFG